MTPLGPRTQAELEMWDRALRAEARIEALEAALRDIESGCMDNRLMLSEIVKIARAALDLSRRSETKADKDAGK